MLLGAILLYWAYEHYLQMMEFEEGRIDRLLMYWFMIVIYETLGFWPTVILPFVAAGTIALAGITLQIRDLHARARGETQALAYQPVHWRGLLTALLVVAGLITALVGLAFLLRVD
jgi:hypothetical protein